MSNIENSLDFEHFCVHKLNLLLKDYFTFKHWSNVPHTDLYNCGYIHDFNKHRKRILNDFLQGECKNTIRDIGVDFVGKSINQNGPFISGQSKLYESKVTLSDTGAWMSKSFVMKKKNPESKGMICTINGITKELSEDLKIHEFDHALFEKVDFQNWLTAKNIDTQESNESNAILRDYQIDCIETTISHFIEFPISKVILNLTCALGKTLIIGNILKHDKIKAMSSCVIALAPIRSDVDNLYKRIPNIIGDKNLDTLLLDSDNDASVEVMVEAVKESIKNKKRLIIFSTFKTASDKISVFIKDSESDSMVRQVLQNATIVVDEVHMLSMKNTRLVYMINNAKKCIFATATLPSYFKTYIPYTLLMDKYDFMYALKNDYIIDYKIMIPMKLLPSESLEEVYNIVKEEDKSIVQKASFLIKGMLQTGSRRCIVYLSSVDECKSFCKAFVKISEEYYGRRGEAYRVNGEVSGKERDMVYEQFQRDGEDVLRVITSCNCLNQSVNLIRCDSTFITNVSKNTNVIVTFQRFMRAMRKDKKNLTKINHCFLYSESDNFNVLEECLMKLKKEIRDEAFEMHVSITNQTYDNQVKEEIKLAEEEEQKNLDTNLIKWIDSHALKEIKAMALLEFVEQNKKVPKCTEIYKFLYENKMYNISIGNFWHVIKYGLHQDLYINVLSNNKILKEDFERIKIVQKKKEEKGELTNEEKTECLLEYVKNNNKTPPRTAVCKYKNIDFNIGQFWNHIKHGANENIYKEKLYKNNILKEAYEKRQKVKEENKEKEDLTIQEKCKELLEFVQKKNRVPTLTEKYKVTKNGEEIEFHIGSFLHHIKHGSHKEMYDILLSKNELIKEVYDKRIKTNEENKNKRTLTPQEKAEALLEYIEFNEKFPGQNHKYNYKSVTFNIGNFLDGIRHGFNKNIYQNMLSQNPLLKDLSFFKK